MAKALHIDQIERKPLCRNKLRLHAMLCAREADLRLGLTRRKHFCHRERRVDMSARSSACE